MLYTLWYSHPLWDDIYQILNWIERSKSNNSNYLINHELRYIVGFWEFVNCLRVKENQCYCSGCQGNCWLKVNMWFSNEREKRNQQVGSISKRERTIGGCFRSLFSKLQSWTVYRSTGITRKHPPATKTASQFWAE